MAFPQLLVGPWNGWIAPQGTTFPLPNEVPALPWIPFTDEDADLAPSGIKIMRESEYADFRPAGHVNPTKKWRTGSQWKFSGEIANLSLQRMADLIEDGAVVSEVALGEVKGIRMTNPGAGYGLAAPAITIGAPDATQATATAVQTSGGITGITITDGGSGYQTAPTVTIADEHSGSGATATATIANGVVTGITITAPGTGFTDNPSVTIAAPTTRQATATAVLSNGAVVRVNVTDAGRGYVNAPSVTLAAPSGGGTTAQAEAQLRGRKSMILGNRNIVLPESHVLFRGASPEADLFGEMAQFEITRGVFTSSIDSQFGTESPAMLAWEVCALYDDAIQGACRYLAGT